MCSMSRVCPENLKPYQLEGLEPTPPLFDYDSIELIDGVNLDIYLLTTHTSAADLGEDGEFKHILEKADILLPETFGWGPGDVTDLNKISKGDYRHYERVKQRAQLGGSTLSNPGFTKALLSQLYNTKVAVAYIDWPAGHPDVRKIKNLMYEAIPESSLDLAFEEELERSRAWLEAFARLNMMREQYMLDNFSLTVGALIEANPRLVAKRQSEGVSVVMNIGGVHSTVADGFAHARQLAVAEQPQLRLEVTPHYGFTERYITHSEQLHARVLRGIEVDDVLVAKVMIIDYLLRDADVIEEGDVNDFVQKITPILDKLSFDDLKNLYYDSQSKPD